MLEPATRLGPYEILASLGAGGMGEVYRARDTRLDRTIALKVLPEEFFENRESIARFEREAKSLAAVSHPNIAVLYSFEEISGRHLLVQELLEGETLRGLLARGPLPVRKALDVGLQVAEGLAAAHGKGIVHRDVKPENVFLTKDGHAKLLDFGLARHDVTRHDPADTRSPTLAAVSEKGVVLGTVAYMSPEQARGETVDFRSDQFSLGAVLYEMLTGRRPFVGDWAAQTMAAIIQEEPEPLEGVAPYVPAPVRWLVERLLAKDPHGRYDATADLARDLRALILHLSEAGTSSGTARAAPAGRRSWRSLPGGIAAALVVAAILATALVTAAFLRGPARTPAPVTRLEIRLPEGHYLSPWRQSFALSPDGRLLVFSAFTWKKPFEEQNDPQLFLRPLDSFEARPIPGTDGGQQPVFSPDGRHVAFVFFSDSKWFLKRVPVAGGVPATICQCDARFGVAWSPDGSILFASGGGPLQKVAESGGTPEAATTLDVGEDEVSHRLPHLLPDGRTVIYTALRWGTMGKSWAKARIFGQRLGDKERSLLAEGGSDGRWVYPGNLLFAREGRLFAAPFEAKALRLGGKPVPILEGVRHWIWTASSAIETGVAALDDSGSGVFAWVPGSVTPEERKSLFWVDAAGKETPVDLPKGQILSGRVSPDGKRILVIYHYPGRQVELIDLARGARRNVTFGMNPGWAIWGPGPDRITFTSDHEGPPRIYSRKLDAGPEEVETLRKGTGRGSLSVGSWSRDGKTLAFTFFDEKTHHDIWLLEPGKELHSFVASGFRETHPDISPDGRWLLFASDEPGRTEVFVRPLTGEGPSRQVSVGGGTAPLWSRDGAAIFYRRDPTRARADQPQIGASALFRVRVNAGREGLVFGLPEKLFDSKFIWVFPGHGWDVAPDGRFLVVKPSDEADRRAWYEKVLSDRIYVDLGGLPALLSEAGKSR